jgi:single-strand DNA-binding protein
MSWDMNSITVVGRLTRDPELSYTQNNTPMCRFSIANNRGNQEGDVNFFDIVAWNKTAEIVNQFCRKGAMVAIEGKLKQNKFVDKATGQNRSQVNIVANSVQFIGAHASGQGQRQAPAEGQAPQDEAAFDNLPPARTSAEDEEVPF